MARIIDPTLHDPVNVGGGTVEFRVTYTLLLNADEIVSFDHAARLWESDRGEPFGGGDDQITAYPIPTTFQPSGQVSQQELFIRASREAADTESGGEEFYAEIWLRRTGSGGPADQEVRTNILSSIHP